MKRWQRSSARKSGLWLKSAYERAKGILKREWDKLEKIVEALLERETLNRDEFEALFQDENTVGEKNMQPSPA